MGDDIVMAFLVEQDQLFVLGVSKRGDMEGPVGIHQQDLVTDEGRRGTEFRQGVVPARTQGNVGFMVELQCQCSLEGSSLANGFLFRVLVQASFGHHQGSGTTEFILVADTDDGCFLLRQCFEGWVARLGTAFSTSSKLFVAVERLRQTIEQSVKASPSFAPFSSRYPHP